MSDPEPIIGQPQSEDKPAPDPGTSEENKLVLDLTDGWAAATRRLQEEHPEFRQLFESQVGLKAARKYTPQIQKKERELKELQLELRRRDIAAMSEKDIETRVASDKAFAQEYIELLHSKPVNTPAPVDESAEIAAAFNDAIDVARSVGVPEDFIKKVTEKALQGGYEPEEGEHWTSSITRINRDLMNEVTRKPSPAAKPEVNTGLTKGGPDTSPASRGATTNFTFKTVADFKALSSEERRRVLDTPGGMEAVDALLTKRT